jgi:hypothetical protein
MYVYTYVLHNMKTVGGQHKYQDLEQQWISRVKGVSAAGLPALR